MAKKKTDKRFTDAKGNLHKHFADGRSEVYEAGCDDRTRRKIEITDEADIAVNRRRFMADKRPEYVEDKLHYRDDDATPGIDHDDPEIDDE